MSKRWIGYLKQNIPGSLSFEMVFYDSLDLAKAAFAAYCRDVGYDDCSMTLYFAGNDQAMYDSAKEFENIGCPFDYPDRIIEHGPNGGVRILNT